MYFVFLENTKIVSNIGANSHNPNAKPVPFPKDSASINLLATDITNNGNPQGAYLGYDVIENNKIRFLFDATPWTFAWFCISK